MGFYLICNMIIRIDVWVILFYNVDWVLFWLLVREIVNVMLLLF